MLRDAVHLRNEAAVQPEAKLRPRAFLGPAADMPEDQARGLNVRLRCNGERDLRSGLGAVETDGARLRAQRGERQARAPEAVLQRLRDHFRVVAEARVNVVERILGGCLLRRRRRCERGDCQQKGQCGGTEGGVHVRTSRVMARMWIRAWDRLERMRPAILVPMWSALARPSRNVFQFSLRAYIRATTADHWSGV